MTSTQPPTSPLSAEAQRLLEFVKYNEPAGPIGCAIAYIAWLTSGQNILWVLFISVAINWAMVASARRGLKRNSVEPSVLKISAGMWAIALALWIATPYVWGLGAIIGLMPVVLAAAYLKRRYYVPIAAVSVGISFVGAAYFLLVPTPRALPENVMAVAILVFAPVLTGSCALAVWHSLRRLMESIDEYQETNEQLIESERSLEYRVDERTAELRKSQSELSAARDEALTANRTKSAFLANMSHELRTPLNAILGYTELIGEEAEEAGHDMYSSDLDRIHGSGKHLLGLINDILDLSKVEAGKVEVFAETFQVADLLRDAAATVAPLLEKNHNTLVPTEYAGLGSMYSDLTRVRQILFNLLSNASKFTHEGTVQISARRETEDGRDWIEISVSDTGIGMNEEQLGRVFEAFSQANVSTTRDYGGTGLGLAITERFCKLLGGNVAVTSHPGEGTEFRVRLPSELPAQTQAASEALESERAMDDPAASASIDEIASDAATILVIDDDETARDLMLRSLVREGYRVVTAGGGEEGLRLARELHPDAITLDVLMPHVDGWSVLSSLKADSALAEIPVILVTMVDDKNLGFALGASEYMNKPIDRERLSKILARYTIESPAPVLVVDDDAATRELMRRTIERVGGTVVEAENGLVALELMGHTKPQMILLDLMMPVMNGFEFLDLISQHSEWRSIPIVVVTAKELTATERQQLDGATERILEKGTHSREELFVEVRRLVRIQTDRTTLSGSNDG